MTTFFASSALTASRIASVCRPTTSIVRPASRSASVSPTHETGVRPLSSATFVFFATPSSVSAK
jgi:hypothetical protein